ncbi:hypothetical protein RJT34_20632 [Clitoria ternatea]|uniref:Uncharacterized protein n=1 Tax=Clitoria ternatea TaxID=43366 RepID=A0AAN9IU91_CLITE
MQCRRGVNSDSLGAEQPLALLFQILVILPNSNPHLLIEYYCKRSGQIPAFGNWDYANELPITQYFESARQAGLVRYSSSSGESLPADRDLYALPLRNSNLKKGTRNRERRCPHVMVKDKDIKDGVNMNMRKQVKVCDVTEQARNRRKPVPKPVDEDLYKIPPELLRTTKRVRS